MDRKQDISKDLLGEVKYLIDNNKKKYICISYFFTIVNLTSYLSSKSNSSKSKLNP